MGYSCGRLASITLQIIEEICIKSTGSSNTFKTPKGNVFYQVGKENRDGAITGSTWRILSDGSCRKTTGFRIEPSGQVSRGPKWMKVKHLRLEIDGKPFGPWLPNCGAPTEENLFEQVKVLAKSLEKGGCNYHLTESRGYIPYPAKASIVGLNGTVMEWKAGAFQVW